MLKTIASYSKICKSINRGFVIQQFRLPDLGEKIKEATVKKWVVKEGDLVDEFDTVAEVATDKLFTEIPSPYKGRIQKLLYKEDEACNVGDVLLEIDTEETSERQSEMAVDIEKFDDNVKKTEVESNHSTERAKVLASPAVRALAKELNIKLEDVKPDRPNEIVTKADVYSYINNQKGQSRIEQTKLQKEKTKPSKQKHGHGAQPSKEEVQTKRSTKIQNEQTPVKMKLFEQGMVKSMTHAATVPHFNLHDEFDLTQLEAFRQSLKAQGYGVTLFSFIVKAFSLAIDSVPRVNASYYPENNEFECHLNSVHNVSIAIDSPQGLAAPNIKNVESLSISEINSHIKELQKITADGKLTSYHLEGGTIALSNIGTITGSFAAPLNLPNQVCIVALGKLNTKPIFSTTTNTFEPKKILPVSFGCDHRVLDGASVARFSLAWKNLLENPGLMLTKLR